MKSANLRFGILTLCLGLAGGSLRAELKYPYLVRALDIRKDVRTTTLITRVFAKGGFLPNHGGGFADTCDVLLNDTPISNLRVRDGKCVLKNVVVGTKVRIAAYVYDSMDPEKDKQSRFKTASQEFIVPLRSGGEVFLPSLFAEDPAPRANDFEVDFLSRDPVQLQPSPLDYRTQTTLRGRVLLSSNTHAANLNPQGFSDRVFVRETGQSVRLSADGYYQIPGTPAGNLTLSFEAYDPFVDNPDGSQGAWKVQEIPVEVQGTTWQNVPPVRLRQRTELPN